MSDGRWQAQRLVELPGDPSALLVVGHQLVIGAAGETVLVDADGAVTPIVCRIDTREQPHP